MRELRDFDGVGKGDVLLVVQSYTPMGTTKVIMWR